MDKNRKKFYAKISSFTLIEIIISVSIVILLTSLSLASFNRQTQEQKLKEEAKKLVNVLELAKRKTFAQDVSNRICNDFKGYQVYFQNQNNQSQYSLRLCCGSTCNPYFDIQPYRISFSFTSLPTNGYIWFQPLASEINFSNNANSFTITIKNSNINKCISINISKFGLINLDNNLTSC